MTHPGLSDTQWDLLALFREIGKVQRLDGHEHNGGWILKLTLEHIRGPLFVEIFPAGEIEWRFIR